MNGISKMRKRSLNEKTNFRFILLFCYHIIFNQIMNYGFMHDALNWLLSIQFTQWKNERINCKTIDKIFNNQFNDVFNFYVNFLDEAPRNIMNFWFVIESFNTFFLWMEGDSIFIWLSLIFWWDFISIFNFPNDCGNRFVGIVGWELPFLCS